MSFQIRVNSSCKYILEICVLIILILTDVTLTKFSAEEYLALEKFRPLISQELYRDYMKEDTYLMLWLRGANLDVIKAEQMLIKTHKFRREQKLDSILEEDFTEFDKMFPSISAGADRDGRPIAIVQFGRWDIRKIILAGRRNEYRRHLLRLLENAATVSRKAFNASSNSPTNWDVPDWIFILDLNGYNLRQQGCLACLPAVLNFATDYDTYYVSTMHTNFILNTPRIFENVLQLSLSLASPRTRNIVKVFGFDKSQWSSELLKTINRDQLPVAYSGTGRF